MRRLVFLYIGCFVISGIFGCASLNETKTDKHLDTSNILLPTKNQLQAIKDEKDERYLRALKYWKDSKQTINDKILSLSEYLKKISKMHSEKGVAYYEERRGEEAAWEFFEALRYDHSNTDALDYLKNRYKADRFVLYQVKEDDTFEKIAEAVYGNFTETFVVAHFSDASKEEDILPGAILKLPLLDSFYSQGLLDYKRDIAIARKYFNTKQYIKLLPFSENILKRHPEDEEASYLVNTALVRIANRLRNQEKYGEAINYLSRVDPSFKVVKKEIEDIRKIQKDKLQQEAQLANIELFNQGEALREEGKYLEALGVYRQIDQESNNLNQAIVSVTKKLKIQADIHYKEGVKFFIADDLTDAIIEWEKTIQLNPGHRRAINYILKAKKLLEKFKTID